MTSLYHLELAATAVRQLKKLSSDVRNSIIKHMDKLKKNPQGIGVKKLVGMENLYRLRVGDYRVVYTLDDTILLILVVKIAHRKDVYKILG